MELQNAVLSYYKHHNTVEFLVFVFPKSAITLSKLYTKKASEKTIILKSCLLDPLPCHSNIITNKDLNVFSDCDLYVCPLMKESVFLFFLR